MRKPRKAKQVVRSEYLGRCVFYFPPGSDFGTVTDVSSDGRVLVKFEGGSEGWCRSESLVVIDEQGRKNLKTLLDRLGGRGRKGMAQMPDLKGRATEVGDGRRT